MEDENQVESQDLETETVEETDTNDTNGEEQAETLTPEELKALREKAAKADELETKNKQLFERAKKAESNKDLSADDIISLTGVPADDRERVRKWATTNGTSIADALADPDLKIILDTRAEERRTADATNTRSGRGSSKVTGDDLLTKALTTGDVPESDEDMAKLVEARQARLTRKKQHKS